MKIALTVNGRPRTVDVDPATPLLWVLRDTLRLHGTKYGCGVGICGACTVHSAGEAVRSCQLPAGSLEGAAITTIEGLSASADHPVQAAWLEEQAPQCGYCQPGMIMAVTAFLSQTPQPSDAQIDTAITNICRCGTYPRLRAAIHRAAAALTALKTRG